MRLRSGHASRCTVVYDYVVVYIFEIDYKRNLGNIQAHHDFSKDFELIWIATEVISTYA